MYSDMDVPDNNRISLEDLNQLNPALFDQIRITATEIADSVMHRLHLQAQGRAFVQGQGQLGMQADGRDRVLSAGSAAGYHLQQQQQQQQYPQHRQQQQQQQHMVKKPTLVKAFIGGAAVTLNADRIVALYDRVHESAPLPAALNENAKALNDGNAAITEKLKYFLDSLQPPPLPPVLLGIQCE